jgi:hypothetical protein
MMPSASGSKMLLPTGFSTRRGVFAGHESISTTLQSYAKPEAVEGARQRRVLTVLGGERGSVDGCHAGPGDTIARMRKRTVGGVLTVWVAGMLACGGGTPPAEPLSVEEFFVRLIDAECAQKVRCSLMPNREVCVDASHPFLRLQLQGDLEAGRLSVDARLAAQCLDAISKVSCNYSDRNAAQDAICNRVFVGAVAEGAPCTNRYQCASGNCVTTCQPLDDCCKGTCGPMRQIVGLGEACEPPARKCTPETLCSGQCVARMPDGQACPNSDLCQLGHICRLSTVDAPMKTCQRKPAHGAPCFDDGCDLDDDYCDPATKRCTQRPRPGAPCDPTDFNDQCVRYAKCDATLGTCVELPHLNQSCSQTGRCIDGLNCGNTCTSPIVAPACP